MGVAIAVTAFIVVAILLVLSMCRAASEADAHSQRTFEALSSKLEAHHAEAAKLTAPIRRGLRVQHTEV